MDLQLGATVFFNEPGEFAMVEQVFGQNPFLSYVEFRGELPFMVPRRIDKTTLDFYKSILKKVGLRSTMHSTMYGINLATLNPWLQEANVRCYKEYIDLCAVLDSEVMVVHAGYLNPEFASGDNNPVYWDMAQENLCQSLRELGDYARPKGVKIALENAPPEAAFPLIGDAEQHIRILETIDHPMVGALLDFGHAQIMGADPAAYLKQIRPYLFELHAHNNHGEIDDHLPLMEGTIDYFPILSSPDIEGVPFIMELTSYEDVIKTLNWLREVLNL